MQVSFNRPNEVPVNGVVQSEPSAPATSIPSTSALTVPVPQVPAVVAPAFFDDNNISFEDIILPRVNCVQKVGDLSEIFNPGEIVYNQTTVIHIPANKEKNIVSSGPLVIVPIGFKKTQYAEKVAGGGRGLFLNSEAEVVAANGTLNWKEWKASKATTNPKKKFDQYATCLLLVKQPVTLLPDVEHQVFTHCIDGEYYALALMGMKGTWYTGLAKRLFTERKIGFLKNIYTDGVITGGGYPSFAWNLTTEIKPFTGEDGGTNYAAVPVPGNGPRTSAALLSYVRDNLGFGS